MKDIAEEEDETGGMLESLCTPVGFEGEFNEVRMILIFLKTFAIALILCTRVDTCCVPVAVSLYVFSQDELLAELEKLEKNVDENLFEADKAEDGNPCPKVLTTTLPSHRGKTCRESFDFILAVGCGVCEFMEVVQGFLFFPKSQD